MSEEESSVEARGAMETKERVAVVLHESKLERTFRAVCLNGAILAVGLSLGLIGTALPDLQSRTNSSFAVLTKIFISRGFGFLVGSIASNFLLSLANQACWITSALVVLAITIATIPNCTSLALLIGTLFLQGVACGVIKAGCGFICRHHFSRVDLAWGKTLFISFAVGAFLAPLLLLPFTSVAISTTSKTGSMRYIEDLPVRASTVSTRPVPVRNGLIAPSILARFHRKRRSIEEETTGFQLINGTVTTIRTMEASASLAVGEKEIGGGSIVKKIPAPFESMEVLTTGDDGNKLDVSTTSGFDMEIVRDSDGKEGGRESSYPVPSSSVPSSSVPSSPIPSSSVPSSPVPPSSVPSSPVPSYPVPSSPVPSFVSSTVSSVRSTTPVANGGNASASLPFKVSPTVVGSSTMKEIPKKPMVADGGMLSSERKVADSSKYRNEIREVINKDIPDDAEGKKSTTILASKTPTSSTFASSPVMLPSVTDVQLSLKKEILKKLLVVDGEKLTTEDAEQEASIAEESVVTLPTTNITASPAGSVQSSIILNNQSLLNTPTSPSTLSPALYSSTRTPVPPSTQSSAPTTPSASTPSSSTTTFQKSVASASVASLNTTAVKTTNKSTSTQTIPISVSVTRSIDAVTEDETPTGQQNLGELWLTKYGYWLAAIVVGLSATSFGLYWVLCPRAYQSVMSPSSEDLQVVELPKAAGSCRVPAFLVVTAFHLLYAGLEVAFGMLITMYAVLRLGWSGRLGVLLGATYWGSFMTCRIMMFVLFRYIRQSLMLLGGLMLCIMVTSAAFLSFQNDLCESNAFIWVTVGALGFGMAVILPGGVSEIDKIFPHQAERFQTFGSAIGEMVLPPVLGFVMTMEDTVWMSYVVLATFVLCAVVAIAIRVLVVRSCEGRAPRGARSLPSLENDDLEDVLTNTNDETELLAKSSHSQTGSPLNGSGSGTQAVTQMAIQSLMKNISNTKKD